MGTGSLPSKRGKHCCGAGALSPSIAGNVPRRTSLPNRSSSVRHKEPDHQASHTLHGICRGENVRVGEWPSWAFRAGDGAFVLSSSSVNGSSGFQIFHGVSLSSDASRCHCSVSSRKDSTTAGRDGEEQQVAGTWCSTLTEPGVLPSLNFFPAGLQWLKRWMCSSVPSDHFVFA